MIDKNMKNEEKTTKYARNKTQGEEDVQKPTTNYALVK